MIANGIRKNLIISADDFGKSELANRNILILAEAGKLDRVSVMANGNFSTEEIERIKRTEVKMDIHLDLADIPQKEKKLKKGILGRGIMFLIKHIADPRYQKIKIEKKWSSQVEKFQELFGRNPDGVNSHQHVHLFGRYFSVSIEIARKYNIPYFRFAKNNLLGTKTNIRRVVGVIWMRTREKFKDVNFDRPDYFASLDWIKDLNDLFNNLPEGKTEIACHPEREEEFMIIQEYF